VQEIPKGINIGTSQIANEMAKPGAVAFPVLLVLGAITGYLTYQWMIVDSVPKPGDFSSSPYYKPLSAVSAEQKNSTAASGPVDESKFSKVVTISILAGASVQGQPSYDPHAPTVPKDGLIKWVNHDSVPHTATSGKGFDEADYGKVFDTGFLDPGKDYSVPAEKVGEGQHVYFCQVHPFMTGTVTVQ
jgi:plastocyanin